MSPTRHAYLGITPGARFETGCIATLTDGTEFVTRHFVGAGSDATRAVADYCDARGLRVVTLSTPRSVYRDLQGSREVDNDRRKRDGSRGMRQGQLVTTEATMLGRINRLDLLERP